MFVLLCCRKSSRAQHRIMRLAFATWLLVAFLLTSQLVAENKPSSAIIRSNKAEVYCGPSLEYYATHALKRGDRVTIIEQQVDGWVAITPPDDSFCWIAARDCKLLPSGQEVEITAQRTVCWIGSHLPQTDFRWQSDLPQGSKVKILSEATRQEADGSEQLWYRIAAPAEEIRWIRVEHLGTFESLAGDSAVVTASAVVTEPKNQTPSTKEKDKNSTSNDKPSRKIQLDPSYQPAAAPKPPRRLNPSRKDSELSPIQPAAAYGPVTEPTPASSPRRLPTRVATNSSPMRPAPPATGTGTNANGPVNWDQFQAFPTGTPAPYASSANPTSAMNGANGTPYASTPVSPIEWLFGDFVHRSGGAPTPTSMTPMPDSQLAQANQPARNYASADPLAYRSRVSQLPRPRRRNSSDTPATQLAGNETSGSYGTGSNRDFELRNPRAPFTYPNALGHNSFATAGYDLASDSANFATTSSWHGIPQPGISLASGANAQSGTDMYAPVNISSPDLQSIQLSLSAEVAKPIEQWNLASFKAATEAKLNSGNDALYRGEARLLLDRIDAFIQLKNRSVTGQAVAPVTPNAPLVPSNPISPSTWVNASQYDASGWLVPVHATHSGQPEYAITDDRGNTLAYVSAQPGVNLRRYLRQPVGLKGRRGYLGDLSANHIVVDRITPLQR